MTTQNPTSAPANNDRVCDCPTCAPGLTVNANSINSGGIFSISPAASITFGTLNVTPPAPQLTVKQAAKAFKKAKAARDAAYDALREARIALKAAEKANFEALDAVTIARDDLEKAAQR